MYQNKTLSYTDYLSDNYKPTIFQTVFKAAIIFAYIYNSAIVSVFTCENLAIIAGFVYILFYKRKLCFRRTNNTIINLKQLILLMVFLLLYCEALVLLFGTDKPHETVSWYLMFLFIYGISGFIVFINLFSNVEDFFRIILIVSVIQGLIVIAGMFVPGASDIIDNLYINSKVGWDYAYMRMYGYPGGINCITSTGSMQISLGLISCIYFYTKKTSVKWPYIVLYVFLSFCATAVARTGLLIAILGLLYLLHMSSNIGKLKTISFILFASIAAISVVSSFGLLDSLSEQFMRLTALSDQGLSAAFLDYYLQRGDFSGTIGIPELSWKTVIGTGITSGTTGHGVYVNADGGFMRLYAGMGLPLALTFYFLLFGVYYRTCKNINSLQHRNIGWFFLVYLVVGELKEPFIIFKRYPVILILVFFYLVYEQECNSLLFSKSTDKN